MKNTKIKSTLAAEKRRPVELRPAGQDRRVAEWPDGTIRSWEDGRWRIVGGAATNDNTDAD